MTKQYEVTVPDGQINSGFNKSDEGDDARRESIVGEHLKIFKIFLKIIINTECIDMICNHFLYVRCSCSPSYSDVAFT